MAQKLHNSQKLAGSRKAPKPPRPFRKLAYTAVALAGLALLPGQNAKAQDIVVAQATVPAMAATGMGTSTEHQQARYALFKQGEKIAFKVPAFSTVSITYPDRQTARMGIGPKGTIEYPQGLPVGKTLFSWATGSVEVTVLHPDLERLKQLPFEKVAELVGNSQVGGPAGEEGAERFSEGAKVRVNGTSVHIAISFNKINLYDVMALFSINGESRGGVDLSGYAKEYEKATGRKLEMVTVRPVMEDNGDLVFFAVPFRNGQMERDVPIIPLWQSITDPEKGGRGPTIFLTDSSKPLAFNP